MDLHTDDQFDSDHYKALLTHLTSSSRDLILELTNIAQKHVNQSGIIADLIEQRIRKCLPQHKLHAFYLLDSIVKNIGNPYNILFSNNLYKLYTETYLLVTDPVTRQYLIELFQTWKKGLSSSGLEIFNGELLGKIEKFIIKATTLNSPVAKTSANIQHPNANTNANATNVDFDAAYVPRSKDNENYKFLTRHPPSVNFPLPSSITPEHFHRECNYLLQYIIQINKDLQPHENTKFYKKANRIRNELINTINDIDESIIRDSRTEFRMKIQYYHQTLVQVRAKLDEQHFKQNIYLQKQFKPNLKPDTRYIKYLRNPLESVEEIDKLYFFLENFGLQIKNEELPYLPSVEMKDVTPPREVSIPITDLQLSNNSSSSEQKEPLNTPEPQGQSETTQKANFNPLGLGFSLDFEDSPDMNSKEPNHQDKKRKLSESKPVKKVRFDV